VEDKPHVNLKEHFKGTCKFIDEFFKSKKKSENEENNNNNSNTVNSGVLVHCGAGVSRSPTLLIAYFLHLAYNAQHEQQELDTSKFLQELLGQSTTTPSQQSSADSPLATLRDIYFQVKMKRMEVMPNNGFMKQLCEYEEELSGKNTMDKDMFADPWGTGAYDIFFEIYNEKKQ